MSRQVLLISDIAGVGKVALSAMIPVMSHMGVNVNNLPTALVSNTLDYGKFHILDTTDYMKKSIECYKELGFSFDGIATGFIVNDEQSRIVNSYCREESKKGTIILCDPIMGDDGHLYPGMGEEVVENMKNLISCADYVIPNYTEGCLLAGKEYKENASYEDVKEIIDSLREKGAKSAAVTSCYVEGKHMVCCYDHREDRYFNLSFDNIPVRFPGTGDIFASCMLGALMNGESMENAVSRSMKCVRSMIEKNLSNEDKYRGINIENCLEEI